MLDVSSVRGCSVRRQGLRGVPLGPLVVTADDPEPFQAHARRASSVDSEYKNKINASYTPRAPDSSQAQKLQAKGVVQPVKHFKWGISGRHKKAIPFLQVKAHAGGDGRAESACPATDPPLFRRSPR